MSDNPDGKFKIFNFKSPGIQTLHITWFAFFMTFVLWFSHAPMKAAISESFNLTGAQWKALLILNVALTIPARIVIGILVDKFGPRITYSFLLITAGFLCSFFALAQSYEWLALARFPSSRKTPSSSGKPSPWPS